MAGFLTLIKELINNLVSFLRYFAAPLVGGCVVWIADADHNVVQQSPDGFPIVQVAGVSVSVWVLLPLIAVFGIALYSAHRAVFMPAVGEQIHKRLAGANQVSMDDLSFARWKRRAAAVGSVERVAQSVLDQANAATDFLYCSCWATVILTGLLLWFFPCAVQVSARRLLGLAAISVCLLLAGFRSHWTVSRLDLMAYKKFA